MVPPQPVRVIVEQSNGAEWWEIVGALGPLVAFLAAVLTGVIGWRSLRHSQRVLEQEAQADRLELEQRALTDRKAQWWERVQWALDAAFSDDGVRRAAGMAMIRVLSEPEWLTKEEILLLDAAWRDELEPPTTTGQSRGARAEEASPLKEPEQRAKIEAARLRVVLDRRLGRATPEWVSAMVER